MRRLIKFWIIVISAAFFSGSTIPARADITIENAEMRLVITDDGRAKSLIHKATGRECLMPDCIEPVFSVTQYRPYENELQLAYPAIEKTYTPESVRRDGDRLIVNFELVNYRAVIGLSITEEYIGFTVEKLEFISESFRKNSKAPIDEMQFLQLPVKNSKHFGEWLNVSWDDEVAVNVLATNHYTRIDSDDRKGYRLLQAGGESVVRLEGIGAALITTEPENLLDRIAKVEDDFDLPRGVESRRRPEYKNSYYELRNVTTENIDRHIAFAQQGGFRAMVIYYTDFAKSVGHFPWRPEYPNGMADLQAVVQKIKAAGMTPGFHIHYNKVHKTDPYVTPVPDRRLNLSHKFTLAKTLDKASAKVFIEENPKDCTLDDKRRILKIGDELISYENYTTAPPYMFTGCSRGALDTTPSPHQSGYLFGVLDVDTWPIFVRFNQNTTIQEELAVRLGKIYHDAGFEFLYFDGAEDIHPPNWFTVSAAQLAVYNHCKPAPLFSQGACKSHFSWHMLSRGNAFDTFKPEDIKEATRKHPAAEAAHLSNDFTALDFGWIGYTPPGDNTIGIQPDMIEYITSRAAAWDCPISLVGVLGSLESHPRTADNLEVIRRWEEVRESGFLTDNQKLALRDINQEHILIINENKEMELLPCEIISDVAGAGSNVRAFVFEKSDKTCAVFWHSSGEASIELPLKKKDAVLFEEFGKAIKIQSVSAGIRLTAGDRRYLQSSLSKDAVMKAFQRARIID